MADTRDPDAYQDSDPRKSISAAPSFEEYLKSRDGGSAEAAAPATEDAAPADGAKHMWVEALFMPVNVFWLDYLTALLQIVLPLFECYSGSGGMADTRDPEAYADEDPRKSISAAPSFEEYLKSRSD